MTRQGVVLVAGTASAIVASRLLGPEIVGTFALFVLATHGLLGPLGDFGVRAAVLRSGADDAVAIATLQKISLAAVLAAATILLAIQPALQPLVGITRPSLALGATLLALLVLRQASAVPIALLERKLRFEAVGAIEATQAILYAVVLAAGAVGGLGVWAYVAAMSVRDGFAAGTARIVAQPGWRGWRKGEVRRQARFGLTLQLASILNYACVLFPVLALGWFRDPRTVGFASWAATIGLYPLFACNAISRMYTPIVRRPEVDGEQRRRIVHAALELNAAIGLPVCAIVAGLAVEIVEHVFTDRWLPAVGVLRAYLLAGAATTIGGPLAELFSVSGLQRLNVLLALLWATLTWTIGLALTAAFGLDGFVVFYAVLQITWLIAFSAARRHLGIHALAAARVPLVVALVLLAANLLLSRWALVSDGGRLSVVLAAEVVAVAAWLWWRIPELLACMSNAAEASPDPTRAAASEDAR